MQYVYDGLGRLTQVIDPSGNTATYNYDAVGNLLSITRSTASPSGLAIFGSRRETRQRVPVGGAVSFYYLTSLSAIFIVNLE